VICKRFASESTMFEPQRGPGESDVEFGYFLAYLDLPRPRSATHLALQVSVPVDELQLLAHRHSWKTRAVEFDAQVRNTLAMPEDAPSSAEDRRKELEAGIHQLLMGKISALIQEPDKLPPSQMLALVEWLTSESNSSGSSTLLGLSLHRLPETRFATLGAILEEAKNES
jgi:hypothetical protein